MVALVLIKLLDLLIEAFYLVIWAAVNAGLNWLLRFSHQWLLHQGISVSPSRLVWIFYWASQGLFALSTFAVIVLHAAKDLKDLRSGRHSGFSEVATKFTDLGRQTSALMMCCSILIGWTLINWALEHTLESFRGNDASAVTHLWHFAAQAVFAGVTLFGVVTPIYKSTLTVYRRLFLPAPELK